MNLAILNTEVQEFISENLQTDINAILLKGTNFEGVDTKAIVAQIEAKKRCKTKLSTWFNTTNIYYPNKLNIEQTSSEITAKYKAELISGNTIIDVTGGFGVDCFYFSKHFKAVTHCEINETLSEIVAHNYKQLQIENITTVKTDGIAYLQSEPKTYDWIYIDPSRRHDSKGKVFFLKDCLPNVPEHLELLFKTAKNILVKTSPLLDISIGINELNHVKTIHIVAVNNEVKELLWVLEHDYNNAITIKTVNIKKDTNAYFNFNFSISTHANYSKPLSFLYEPNAAILKSGAFNQITQQLPVFKLHQHSHLYTNETMLETFPGRIFKIENNIAYNKKVFKKLGISKANITTRNFPETVQQIRKKLHIKDGGSLYIFFTTDIDNNKIALLCSKV
ncbi:class I SAM-dependent methyltransferase [Seonamhaeicola algicola]|uniref:Class I SAM-dependent methyltransferase n=1 Tax=Seonamhaeicola algicola TaxID=1719036 RepID=A0A5C7B1R5_9FLAO|nr:class I SAM-dependent methyltransferase [Seonamhaeicola algicola]TXE15076.1 class I SAM-dependent methyltransferase [Seonamhaeicola algicola]